MPEARIDPANGGFPAISQPALRALRGAGIERLEDCTRWREADLAAMHGVGPAAIRVLGEALAARGLRFAPAREPDPAAFHLGAAHLIVYGNAAFRARYGASAVGMPAREAMTDMPSGAYALMDRVLGEGRPLAMSLAVGGERRRFVVAPRRDIETGETYGVATHLRRP